MFFCQYPDTDLDIKKEVLEKVATKCKHHTYNEMAKVLGVQSKTLNKQVWRTKLVFTNLEENDPKTGNSIPV